MFLTHQKFIPIHSQNFLSVCKKYFLNYQVLFCKQTVTTSILIELENYLIYLLKLFLARMIFSKNLLKVPAAPDTDQGRKMTKYELSMKIGLKDNLNILLLVLCLCRTIKELIVSNLAVITENCCTRGLKFIYAQKI